MGKILFLLAFLPALAFAGAAPDGYVEMCSRSPALPECGGPFVKAPEAPRWSALLWVNKTVNAEMTYVDDQKHYGVPEFWEVPRDMAGNCHAYALVKLHRLLDRGWDIRDLRLAVGELKRAWHVVLIVHFDGNDWVLDNDEDHQLKRPSETDIHWNRIQEIGGSQRWVPYSGRV
jgi:predicted transglutaminase-like cysteine proteinase